MFPSAFLSSVARAPVIRLAAALALCAAASGCAVTMHGNQTSGGGTTTTTVGSSVNASASSGHARVGASFGSPPPANAPGGSASFSRSAAGVLVIGLAIGDLLNYVGGQVRRSSGLPVRPAPVVPDENISRTCSCYGWKPELTESAPAP